MKQTIVTLDLEGVLVPEIWIAVAEKTGIADLRRTTRDEPDYDKLMRYRIDILDRHGVAHTYNYWSAMPMPGEQADLLPPDEGPFAVVRLLLRPGTWYEDQKARFSPFNALVEPDEAMRRDVVAIARRVVNRGRRVFVLVNNKAEGSSPLTVTALARQLTDTDLS